MCSVQGGTGGFHHLGQVTADGLDLRFAFTLAGVPVELEREVVYRARDQAVGEVNEEKRIELASQGLDIASENVWAIGTYLLAKAFMVVKNNFRNVPEEAVSDWVLRTPKNTHTEQYFIKS